MPIRFTFDPKARLLFTTAEGLVTFEDSQKHFDEQAAQDLLGCCEIFDASNATTNLTSEEIRKLVSRVQTLAESGPFGPIAVVTTNAMFFGMARMFAILSELRGGRQVAVFRNFDEALDWLVRGCPQ